MGQEGEPKHSDVLGLGLPMAVGKLMPHMGHTETGEVGSGVQGDRNHTNIGDIQRRKEQAVIVRHCNKEGSTREMWTKRTL